jgi:hypothetical protein
VVPTGGHWGRQFLPSHRQRLTASISPIARGNRTAADHACYGTVPRACGAPSRRARLHVTRGTTWQP